MGARAYLIVACRRLGLSSRPVNTDRRWTSCLNGLMTACGLGMAAKESAQNLWKSWEEYAKNPGHLAHPVKRGVRPSGSTSDSHHGALVVWGYV